MESMQQRRRHLMPRWAFTATALAALAACGGGGGSAEPEAPTNQAPTISVNTPAASASFTQGTAIAITATAADADGTVAKVEFFAGTTKLGEDTTAPFEFTWTPAAAGTYEITARATDNAGAIGSSASRTVTITATPTPTNAPPTVSLSAPANNFKANAPATITLAATAADSDGTVASVSFYRINPAAPVYDATTLVGAADTTAPYEQSTGALAAGTYTFVARATDNRGAVATSATAQVIVNALPTVSFLAPAANAVVQVGAALTLRATAADAAPGSVTKVEFFNGTTLLGEGTRVTGTNEYTYNWASVPAGPKSLTARATDNDGATQTTASLAINANGQPTVTLDVPTAGATAPTTLVLAASATDADGTIASVEFFNGTTRLGAGTFDAATSRYRLSVPNTGAGTYTLTARATDNNGGTATSASRSLTIAGNVAPTVSMTSAASFTLPAAVTFTATAADTDGIARVEFFEGANKLGEDTSAPFEFTWTAATAGTYSITARATDTVGTATTSAVQSVTINPSSAGMWSSLTAAQRGGITTAPNLPTENVAVDAVKVMTAIGVTRFIPAFNPAMAFAARRLADFIPAAGATITCPGGGTVQATAQTSGPDILNYNNCVIDGFTFFGGAGMGTYPHTDSSVTPPVVRAIGSSVDYFRAADRLELSGLRVTGNGAPEAGGESYPRNAYASSTPGGTNVTCTGTGAARSCLVSLNNTHLFGNNVSWASWLPGALVPPAADHATDDSFIVNGTWRSLYAGSPGSSNIRFEAFTNVGGRAIVYGSNGYSVVTRLAPLAGFVERLSIVRTVVTQVDPAYPVGTSAPIVVNCSVIASQGEWGCQVAP